MGHGRVLLAALGVVLAFPAMAWGDATVSPAGGVYTYTDTAGGDNFDNVTVRAGQDTNGTAGYRFISNNVAQPISGCEGAQGGDPGRVCEFGGTGIVFNLADGTDTATMVGFVPNGPVIELPTTMNGGTGNDTLVGGNVDDILNGDAGNDMLRPRAGGGTLNGGDGTDTASFDAVAVTVSIDGAINDGPTGTLNVQTDVENLEGSTQGDTLTGSAGVNLILGSGGNDTIAGGAGADELNGGADNDTINARDGVVDTITCGAGTDTVTADSNDSVNADCENRAAIDDDSDGSPFGIDCNDTNALIKPGAGEIPNNGVDEDCSGADATVDGDGDGSVPPADCDDTNPGRRPGIRDRPRNGVDENCDGRDADWRVNRARIVNNWLAFPGYTLVDALRLRDIPARGRATVRCTGRGCPFKKAKRLRVRNRRANATALFKGDRLLPGARIEIRITAPETMGKVLRYTMRAGKLPAKRELCLAPGRSRPGRC